MPPNVNLSDEEKWKWNEIMKYFKKNPEMLLELMPEDVDVSFTHKKKSQPRKGMSMIPDLDVVPPQSGHMRKKSYSNVRHPLKNYPDQTVLSQQQKKVTPVKVPSHYFKPNTAINRTSEDYVSQTPSFLTSNIVNTVNKTVYKVSNPF